MSNRYHIAGEVLEERLRQDRKWGEQRWPDGTHDGPAAVATANYYRQVCQLAAAENKVTWKDILLEEVWEAMAEVEPKKLREELIQVAAVAVQWIEVIDSRPFFREEDLKVEVYRVNGQGMYVPTNDVSVKITHVPTGKVSVATEKSALRAKAEALSGLQILFDEGDNREAQG